MAAADCWDENHGTYNLGIRRGVFDRVLRAWIGLTNNLEAFCLGHVKTKLDGLWTLWPFLFS